MASYRFVDGESGEQHDWDRILRHPLDDPRARGLAFERGRRQRVVADNAAPLGVHHYVHPRGPSRRRLPRVTNQPNVQRGSDRKPKPSTDVRRPDRLGIAEQQHYSGRGRRNSSPSSGISRGGRSSADVNLRHWVGESTNRVRSASSRSARSRPLSTRNSDSDSFAAAAALRNIWSSLAATRRCSRWSFVSAIRLLVYAICAHRSHGLTSPRFSHNDAYIYKNILQIGDLSGRMNPVSKTGSGLSVRRGFESLPLR